MAGLGLRGVRAGPPVGPRPLRRLLRSRAAWALLLATCLLALYLARGALLPRAARFLDVSEPPQPVEYVLVLGGGVDTRPFVAAALVRSGLAGKVLLSNPRLSAEAEEGTVPAEAEVARRVLAARGLAADQVVTLPDECATTFDEAQSLARFLDREPAASVAVVTSTYHTRRARWIFTRVLGPRKVTVHFVGAPTDGFDESNWWRFESGLQTYLDEYLKLVFYLGRY